MRGEREKGVGGERKGPWTWFPTHSVGKPVSFLCSRFWIAGFWVSVCVLAEILPVIQPRNWKVFSIWRQSIAEYWKQVNCPCIYKIKTLHIACIMFGAWTKLHVCQVGTWNMCYPLTCLCTFVFSWYFSAPETFQLAKRVLSRQIYSRKPSQEITI